MFLKSIPERGYPEDYLLSRIKGRRTSIIRDWRFILHEHDIIHHIESLKNLSGINSDLIDSRLWKEYYWVYSQMNESLRRRFHNFFEYMEIMRFIRILRYRKDNDIEMIKNITMAGLLSEEIEDIILFYHDFPSLIKEIEKRFISISNLFRGLTDVYEREGQRGIERFIMDRYLQIVILRRMDNILREFFVHAVDSRNIIFLFKSIKWSIIREPYFISGGRIERRRFLSIYNNKKIDELVSLVKSVTGVSIKGMEDREIENALYGTTSRMLKQKARTDSTALILHYLWSLYIEARNIRTLLEGRGLDREILLNEVVS